jgi:cytochrome P450
MVEVLDIYGRNVVTTEGQEWRLHRKVTSRPFSEKNNQLVHDETVRQTTQMMNSWDSRAINGQVQIDRFLPSQHEPITRPWHLSQGYMFIVVLSTTR